VSEIFELHFADEDEKSEERKEKESRIKKIIEFFTKTLNLIVYGMLVFVIMKVVVITAFNPTEGLAEAHKIVQAKNRWHVSPLQDTIEMKNDTILHLRKEIDNLTGIIKSNPDQTENSNISTGDTSYPAGTITKYNIPNYDGSFSLTQFLSDCPTIVRIGFILVSLLIILWLMKLIIKLFYIIGNLISPFSIVKIIGLCTFISWIFINARHIFEASSLYNILDKLNPF
jgi:hypothetical protein